MLFGILSAGLAVRRAVGACGPLITSELCPVHRSLIAMTFVTAFAVSMVTVSAASKFRMEGTRWWLAITGASICAFEVFAGRMRRFWITGGLAACGAIALAASSIPLQIAMGLYFTFVSTVEIASGGLVLYSLLQSSKDSEA